MKLLTKQQLFNLEIKYPEIKQFGEAVLFFYPTVEQHGWYNNPKVWKEISEKCRLTEDFMREFQEYLNWHYICRHQTLSEDFIKEFQHQFNIGDWSAISYRQILTEDFMREFKNKLDWEMIVRYQVLPYKFIIEMKKEGYIR